MTIVPVQQGFDKLWSPPALNNNRPKPVGLGLLAEKGPQVTFELCFTGVTVLSRFRQSRFFLISRLLP